MLPEVNHLNILFNVLTLKYFSQENCIFTIADSSAEIFNHGKVLNVILEPGEDFVDGFSRVREQNCGIFVIKSARALEIFEAIEESLKFDFGFYARYNNRKYLIFPSNNSIKDIWNSPCLEYITDMLVVEETEMRYYFWTHDYVNISGNPILLDVWFNSNKSFQFSNNLYPDKLKNRMGKVLKLCSLVPYAERNSELIMLREYMARRNLTEDLVVLPPLSWGSLFDNFTGTGLYGMIIRDEADLAVGYIYTALNKYTFMDLSHSLVRLGVTCLVPRPSLITTWYTISYTFSYQVWLYYLFCYFILGSLLTIVSKVNRKSKCDPITAFLHITGIFFQQDVQLSLNITKKQKLIFTAVSISILIINSAYSSRLSSLLVAPRFTNDIQTVDDLDKSNIEFGGEHDGAVSPIKEIEKYKALIDRFQILNYSEIERKMLDKSLAFMLGRLQLFVILGENFPVGFNTTIFSTHQLMDEDLFWNNAVFFLRKNNVFLDDLNSMIMKTIETGLNIYWEMQVSFINNKYELALKSDESVMIKRSRSLEFAQVMDAYFIWIIGLTLATFVFFLEYCMMNRPRFYHNVNVL